VWEVTRGRYDALLLVDDFDIALAAVGPVVLTLLPGRPILAAVCHEPRPRNRWASADLFVSSRSLLALLRCLYPRLDVVFVHGETTRREFVDAWPPTRVAVIPHGDERIVAGTPPPPSREERILFFGDWRRAKGLHELMAAFERVADRRPAARLTIAGTPSPDADPPWVRRWAAARPDRVEVIDGYVPLEEVPGVFARARVVATPYLAGSQSGVLHLAMTMQRAIVTSDIGELGRTVVDGETGRVVAAGDVDALADALEALLADPALCERLGAEARRRLLAESAWERAAERVEAELLVR
jgi:glycosyltransferase involved in cell wall biosynthesis